MTLNLTQLHELRINVNANPNRTVSKHAFLTLLDSHISVLSGKNELTLVRDTKEHENGLLRVYEHYALSRYPPTMEQVKKAYNVQ